MKTEDTDKPEDSLIPYNDFIYIDKIVGPSPKRWIGPHEDEDYED